MCGLAVEDFFNGVHVAYAAGMTIVVIPDLEQPTDEIHAMCMRVAMDLSKVNGLILKRTRPG